MVTIKLSQEALKATRGEPNSLRPPSELSNTELYILVLLSNNNREMEESVLESEFKKHSSGMAMFSSLESPERLEPFRTALRRLQEEGWVEVSD